MIIVEDIAHFTLIKTIHPTVKVVIAGSKYKVGHQIQKNAGSIGIIDEDSNNSPSTRLTLLNSLKPVSDNHFIKVYTGTVFTKVIVICPIEVEDWLLRVAKNSKIDVRDFGLANSHAGLKKEFNFKLKKVDELLLALVDVKSPELLHLKSLLV